MCNLTIYTCQTCGNKDRTEWLSCKGVCGQGPNCGSPYFRNLIFVDRCNKCDPPKDPSKEEEGSYWDIPQNLLPDEEGPVKWKNRTYRFFHSVSRYTWGRPFWKNHGHGQWIYYNFDEARESYIRMPEDPKPSGGSSKSVQKSGKGRKVVGGETVGTSRTIDRNKGNKSESSRNAKSGGSGGGGRNGRETKCVKNNEGHLLADPGYGPL